MKLKEITPYLIIGAVIAVIAFFVMPWVHTLRWPNATYAEGLSFANAMIALVIGFIPAYSLYRDNRRKKKAAENDTKPCAAAGEPGADVPGADGGHRGPNHRGPGGQRPGDEV